MRNLGPCGAPQLGFNKISEICFTGYSFSNIESGSQGIVSNGIMLMETFTRKKPTGEMCLKDWVLDSLQSGEMMDSKTNESDLAANMYNLS
ncbi:hypothetical protein GH714_003084 [Hevea brasiliensis]|uniref:Uncharacterized protein n=1 Tax=Hevea brasiliensis TaxID=3981 RepID=A0A6A6MYP0_HEVBR|nr:hypothetical protein GH714_003084 [Hevea brasiliensis]